MINLDLLPQNEKVNLEWDLWSRLILIFSGAVLAGLGFFSLILIQANLYFLENIGKTAGLLDLHVNLPMGREIKIIEERLELADEKTKQISEIIGQIRLKSFIPDEIASILPDGCRISSLEIKNDGSVALAGLATERETLLSFKKNLEDNGKISDLNFPLANLFKEKDIEFSLSFKIKNQ